MTAKLDFNAFLLFYEWSTPGASTRRREVAHAKSSVSRKLARWNARLGPCWSKEAHAADHHGYWASFYEHAPYRRAGGARRAEVFEMQTQLRARCG